VAIQATPCARCSATALPNAAVACSRSAGA
jgi:hypothetical protein